MVGLPDKPRQRIRILHVLEIDALDAEILHRAIHGPDQDERHGAVQRDQHGAHAFHLEPMLADAAPEEPGKTHKGDDDEELEDQGGFEEGAPRRAGGGAVVLVGAVGGAVCGEDFDDRGEAAKSGDDAARVQGGVLRDVVEAAAEGDVVCEFVDGAEGKGSGMSVT